MASLVDNDTRDQLRTLFREAVCTKLGVAPYLHQREVWAASDGLILTGAEDPEGHSVRLIDGTTTHAQVAARPDGRARFVADLGAFKIGKSWGAALWAAGFAAVPGGRVALVGLEYDICEPEFSYLCEFLLSERGMNIKATSLQNRPRDGKMFMDLPNGCRYEAKSWERKDTLKGKEIDAYIYCEAYMLPGLECFTAFSQNLRVRRGYAYFATTPDRPWVLELHKLGHGEDAEWHCTCSVPADVNPIAFDAHAKERDRTLMTAEKFAIHYEGKLGDFVGKVFNYAKGERTFTDRTHPDLFDPPVEGDQRTLQERLRVPTNWTIMGGADTGTFYSGLLVAFSPDGDAYVLDEFPNYRYIAGSPERDEALSIPGWALGVTTRTLQLGGRCSFWADANSQFKGELRNYGITLLPAIVPVETRTEIAREYFQHDHIYLAPWLQILPFELENAQWPEEASLSGKFARLKDRDHTLDPLEHVLARRPRGRPVEAQKPPGQWADQFRSISRTGNIHVGR